MNQFLVVYTHDDGNTKLAHVAIFNEFYSNGKPNIGWTINHQYSRVYAIKDKLRKQIESDSVEHSLDSGLTVMMLNTLKTNWCATQYIGSFTLEQAKTKRAELRQKLIDAGYTVTRGVSNKCIGLNPEGMNENWGKITINIHNYTQSKLYKLCDNMTVGMQFAPGVFEGGCKTIYNTLFYRHNSGEMKKSDIWKMFNMLRTYDIAVAQQELEDISA